MTTARADVTTEHGSRYLQQLCKHWSHKLPVTFDPHEGHMTFEGGECRLAASDTGMSLVLTGESPERVARLCGVVADHLKRFAFREELELAWSDPA